MGKYRKPEEKSENGGSQLRTFVAFLPCKEVQYAKII